MPISDQRISGQARQDRIDALARGNPSPIRLAEIDGVTVQAIYRFTLDNKEEIEARRRELFGAVADEKNQRWIEDTGARRDMRMDLIERLLVRLANPNLEDRVADRLSRTISDLIHATEDEQGALPTRIKAEHEITNMPYFPDAMVEDVDGNLHPFVEK